MDINSLLSAPSTTVVAQATNGIATATISGRPGFTNLVIGVTVSANGAVAAAVLFQITDPNYGSLEEFYLPASAFAPIAINYHHGLAGSPGSTITATLPALGAAITGKIAVKYIAVWS